LCYVPDPSGKKEMGGACHFNPPTVFLIPVPSLDPRKPGVGAASYFAPVAPDMWCARYAPKNPASALSS
jgi:hypothetical protein